jgi:23S rRNA (cytosine1962-C5)-methyltransferase
MTTMELLDCGNGRRLERFGDRTVDRPAPSAIGPRRAPDPTWAAADLVFERGLGWRGPLEAWPITVDGITLELRPTYAGQLGFFPEHAALWPWLRTALAGRDHPAVLHLFAHTGATTLALAAAGARVTHVDASRPALAWARRNADLSTLADRPVRWIVDDALGFARREGRRGRRYDGIVLDPPSFGHSPTGTRWELRETLPDLLDACAAVATDDAFVLLSTHTSGLEPDDLRDALVDAFDPGPGADVEADPVEVVAASGAILPLGAAARMIRG